MGEAPPPLAVSPGISIGMVAGEASGDLLAADILRGLGSGVGQPGFAFGVGGPAMRAQGFEAWVDIERLSVRGYAEVLTALPRLLALRRSLFKRILDRRPNVFVGVDAPDFNLGLERKLKAQGLRTIHFISPSIWAWRPERIASIRAAVDHLLLVFPFEQAIYDAAGIPATYVGHPLADRLHPVSDPAPAKGQLGLDPAKPVIALLPGSRIDEIRFMGCTFIQTAAWLLERRPDCQIVIPAASDRLHRALRQTAETLGLAEQSAITILRGQSHVAMSAADAVLIASGTATLEAALLGKPMTICYKMSPISYHMMRGRALLPWIGLPNILCKESLVPEFVQNEATPERLGRSVLDQLDDDLNRRRLHRRFSALHSELRRGCAERSAAVISEVCRLPSGMS